MHPIRLNRNIYRQIEEGAIRLRPHHMGVKSSTPVMYLTTYGIVVERRSDSQLRRVLPLYDRLELRDYILYRLRRPATRVLITEALKTQKKSELEDALTHYPPELRLSRLIKDELRERFIRHRVLPDEAKIAAQRKVARTARQKKRAELFDRIHQISSDD